MTRRLLTGSNLSVLVTFALFALMFAWGGFAYFGFFTLQNFFNLFIDNAYLLILGVGMTFVIITGGIDLSVGSMLGLCTVLTSALLQKGMNPILVIVVVLGFGAVFGLFHGALIQLFDLPPFIITLSGLYLARGLCYVVSLEAIPVTDPFFLKLANGQIGLFGDSFIKPHVVMALVMVVVGAYILRFTRFGRTIYAIGGNEQSALLMGLPVTRTKILLYAFSGFCSALAGIVFTIYTSSGYALNGKGMELDAIASVVIGGTLLTGGAGSVLGTVLGVLVYGTIQTLIFFQGTLNSWWTRIAIGFLVFVFCVLQRVFESRKVVRQSMSRAAAAGATAGSA
jgi:ribose/xylose/arabinose/galactoside ABC-type transport system permease subunit